MQKLMSFFWLPLLFTSFNGIAQIKIKATVIGSEHIIEREKAIPEFNSIWIEDGWNLVLSQGDEIQMLVETDSNFFPHLSIEVKD